jgi:hypothetical protein
VIESDVKFYVSLLKWGLVKIICSPLERDEKWRKNKQPMEKIRLQMDLVRYVRLSWHF